MRVTKLFRDNLEATLTIGSQMAIMGAFGHFLGSISGGLAVGGALGIYANMSQNEKDAVNGALKTVKKHKGTRAELEKIVSGWKGAPWVWQELVVLDATETPDWIRLLRGQWVAEGIAIRMSSEESMRKINWRWLNWLEPDQLDEAINHLMNHRGWESRLEKALREMDAAAWSNLSRETLRTLLMSNDRQVRLAAMAGSSKRGVKGIGSAGV